MLKVLTSVVPRPICNLLHRLCSAEHYEMFANKPRIYVLLQAISGSFLQLAVIIESRKKLHQEILFQEKMCKYQESITTIDSKLVRKKKSVKFKKKKPKFCVLFVKHGVRSVMVRLFFILKFLNDLNCMSLF